MKAYGQIDHVVIYAGDGMIVQEHEPGRNAEYHNITELIFDRAGNGEEGENYVWQKRLPVYAVNVLSEEEREKFTVK